MPRDKDLKRLVRARMQKTGEAYTAARMHILTKPKATARANGKNHSESPPNAVPAATTSYAALAGYSDAKLKAKTGCTWERWTKTLDALGAEGMSHGEIVRTVQDKFHVEDWWSQMVTVGYERIKGLRARGQRLDGSYSANKSRTFDVPVATLFRAWARAGTRKRWLTGATVKVRTATSSKSMRLDWAEKGSGNGHAGVKSIVAVGFLPRGKTKSTVAVQHEKLPDRETAKRLKQYWAEQLDALGTVLPARATRAKAG